MSISDIAKYVSGSGFLLMLRQYENALIIGRMFLIINSFINPFIYGLVSKFYRQEVKKMFCQWCTSKENQDMLSNTVFSLSGPKPDPGGTLGVDNAAYGSELKIWKDEDRGTELNQV